MITVILLISITFITLVLISGDSPLMLAIGMVFFLSSLAFLAYFGYIQVPDILVWKDN